MTKKKFALDYGFVDFERYTERMTYNENDIYFASDYVIRLDSRRPRLFRRVCSRKIIILTTTSARPHQTKIIFISIFFSIGNGLYNLF